MLTAHPCSVRNSASSRSWSQVIVPATSTCQLARRRRFYSYATSVLLCSVGHGTRPLAELVEMIREAGVTRLVDVRRFPGSRRNPQFGREPLQAAVEAVGIEYRHEIELGGRRSGEPGEERFACLRVAAFRSYAAR